MTKLNEEIDSTGVTSIAAFFEPLDDSVVGLPEINAMSTYTISSNCSYSSRQVQWFWSSSKGNYANDSHLYNINVSGGQTVTITLKCTLNETVEASAYMRVIYIDDNGKQVSKNLYYGQSLTLDFSSSTQLAVQTIISGTGSYAYAAYGARQQYSIEAKYTMAQPDLLFFTPTGWSGALVASKTTGTNSNSSSFTTDDNVYIDFAFGNAGGDISKTYYVSILVDGKEVEKLSVTGGTEYGEAYGPEDYNLGKLSAGQHTITVKLDSTGVVSESNESNNTVSKTITVTQSAKSYDLKLIELPEMYDGYFCLSVSDEDIVNATSFTTDDTVYLTFFGGDSNLQSVSPFQVAIYVDGNLVEKGGMESLELETGSYVYPLFGYELGRLTAGSHTVKVVVDPDNKVAETNESNNTYTRTITVKSATKPDLAEYAPSGWSGSIVTSTVTGTNTNASKITTDDSVYVDFSFGNDDSAIGDEFYVALALDGEIVDVWSVSSMKADSYSTIKDYDLGKLSAGEHTLIVWLDPTETIAESDEDNNIFYKTFTVTQKSVSADSYESGAGDNSRFKATKLTVGQTQSHTIHSKTDEDWMVFEVAEDGFYSVVTSGGGHRASALFLREPGVLLQ